MADDDQDRISSLPEGILHRILSRLPTVSVVRTSVLSKRWSRVWASISRLDFIEAWLHRCKIKLLEFMDNFLQHRDPDAAITRLRLCMQYDFEVVASSRLLYGWLSRIDMKTLRWLYLFVQDLIFPKKFRRNVSPPLPNVKHIKVKVQKLETKSKLRNSVRWMAPFAETLSVKEEPGYLNRQNLEFARKVSVHLYC